MTQFLLYFGCWDTSKGHFLVDRHRHNIHTPSSISEFVIPAEVLDGSRLFLPSPEMPGRGRLTHVVRGDAAVTVLAWWDRTFDSRPRSNAAIQSDGWCEADDIWMRFSHVYSELAAKLTKPEL